MRWVPILILLALAISPSAWAQDSRLREMEVRISRLESKRDQGDLIKNLSTLVASGFEVASIALFCGFWARSTGRDFWLWLAAGLVFNVFALLAVWAVYHAQNEAGKKDAKAAGATDF